MPRRSLPSGVSSLAAALAGCGVALASVQAHALDPSKALSQYVRDTFQTAQGLPQNSVLAEARTPDGYLWLGTYEGLVRFDGVRFVTFDKESAPAFTASWVTALLTDREGTLWVGTADGLLTRKNGEIERVSLPQSSIKALAAGLDRSLWIGTEGGGLLRKLGDGIEAYGKKDGLCGESIASLSVDARGTLWIGTFDGGLCSWSDGRFSRGEVGEALGATPVSRVLVREGGAVWVGTHGAGLFRWEGHEKRVFTTADGLPSNSIGDLFVDHDGSFFAGTTQGVARLEGERFSALLSRPGAPLDVHAFLEDPEGSVWIGTEVGGLVRLKDGSFVTVSIEEGLGDRFVHAVLPDPDGGAWISTDRGGVSLFRDGRVTTFTMKDGLASDVATGLFQDGKGTLWTGSFGDGVSFRPRGGGEPFRTLGSKDGMSAVAVTSFAEHEGALFVGGDRLLRYKDGAFTTVGPEHGVPTAQILYLFEDRDKVLWICTASHGIGKMEHDRATFYTTREGLAGNNAASVTEDSEGAKWIATGTGISRYKEGKFRTFTAADGLHDSAVHQVIWDDVGSAWMSTNKGIFSFRRSDLESYEARRIPRIPTRFYGTAQGMKNRECNGGVQPAGAITKDGRVWFATIDGAVVVDPKKLHKNPVPPPVHVEAVQVDRQPVKAGPALVLQAGTRDLELQYTALSMIDPERVAFRYRLHGYDRDWVEAGTRRSAFYTNLPPGTYRFQVVASNDEGIWNETGAEVGFEILPFFYQRKLFWALSALAVLLASAGAFRARVRYLVKRQEALARHNEELSAALAAAREAVRLKGEFVANISHELRTPLNAIINIPEGLLTFFPKAEVVLCSACGSRFELEAGEKIEAVTRCPECRAEGALSRVMESSFMGDPDVVARHLTTLHRSGAHLSRLIDGVLDFSKLEAGRMQIAWEDVPLAELVGEIRTTALGLARPKRIQVDFHLEAAVSGEGEGLPTLRTDRVKCTQILLNLISNAIKFSGEGTCVSVSVHPDGGAFVFQVTDQGVGIASEQHAAIFDSFHQVDGGNTRAAGGTGLGLTITKQLVALLEGSIWLESELGKGTTFFVRLGGPARDKEKGGPS